MDLHAVPPALRSRLGPDATEDLLELFDLSHRETRDAVIEACTDRVERRLVEEISKVRVDMAHLRADLRQELATMGAGLRQEMVTMGASLRQETANMGGSLRQELATGRVELFKWCFLFWIGQVLAIGGLLGVLLRLVR